MSFLKGINEYAPPDFSLFEKTGYGLVYQAYSALENAFMALYEAQLKPREEYPAWSNLRKLVGHDLVDIYGEWGMADDMVARLNCMESSELEKHLELDVPKFADGYSLEKANEEFIELTGKLAAWEVEEGKEFIYPALNRHLEGRIQNWEHLLARAEKEDFDENSAEPGIESMSDYCLERSKLDYAASAIHMLRFAKPTTAPKAFARLRPLPYYDTYCKRLEELDAKFRRVLNGRYSYEPWADPEFWWHHPPKPQRQSKH